MDVSVIMPAYNAEKYIAEAIDSVLAQDFSGSYEILIADDASTDSTPDIIKKYQSEHPNIIKADYRKDNIGANPNSYNLCKSAKGRYLAFIDADDVWLAKDKLQKQFDFLENNEKVGAVCSNAYYIDDKGVSLKHKSDDDEGFISFEEIIVGHKDIFCSSFVCRRDLFMQMADDSKWYIDNGSFNDTVWALWMSYHNLLYRMKSPFSAYRVLKDSACHSSDKEKQVKLSRRYFLKKICFLLTHDYPLDEKMDIISDEYDYIIKNAYYAGEKKVRATKTFKVGKRIKDMVRIIKRK
ncbi:MAG: glycosyltransferase [Bacteroidales bacterium]|nr:glycosyltransferase [Bacteroidales bacterium]